MKKLLLIAVALSLSACVFRARHRDGPSDYPPPPPPDRRGDPLVVPQQVIQVKELKARRVFANVIHCKEIHANEGRIGEQRGWQGGKNWGGGELKQEEVRADTIYAKEIHADYVEAGVVYCKEVKMGR